MRVVDTKNLPTHKLADTVPGDVFRDCVGDIGMRIQGGKVIWLHGENCEVGNLSYARDLPQDVQLLDVELHIK